MAHVRFIKPAAGGIFPVATFEDISFVNDSIVFDLSDGWDYLTIQLVQAGSVTLGSFVNKIQMSNDGGNPQDFSTPVTLSTASITSVLSVSSIRYVHSTITTAGTSGKLKLYAVASRRRLV
jgi:hypothetical protein